jgi:tetratricopeptide (TPR) repeat protein
MAGPPTADPSPPPADRPEPAGTDAVYALLAGMTFSQAVCWVIARVADGLAHAHARGIVHRDVKPANVLVADDGQPMLLDFGVAADLKAKVAADAAGGTIPYMAPEQLAHLFAGEPTPDPRADVYAVGVILYEWLTGTHPFSPPTGDLEAELPRLVAERKKWVPRLPAGVPADLAAVVRTCVAADPARRYQTAADLSEDLRRHLAHEPLRVAPEPAGWWGRLAKWRKRNPRSGGQLLVAGGVVVGLVLCLGAVFAWRGLAAAQAEQARQAAANARQLEQLDAARQFAEVQADLRDGRYALSARASELRADPADLARVQAALARYGLPDDPDWRTRPAVAALPGPQQVELLTALADGCLLVARARLKAGDARSAERFNTLAETVRPGLTPQVVFTQRAAILDRLGRPAEAAAARERADQMRLFTAEDHFLAGDELLAAGRPADALGRLREAVRLDPAHFWAQFQLGVCHQQLGRPAEARACYSAAVALRPDCRWAYFNRAMATAALRTPAEVVADLDAVLRLAPDFLPARLHRAHALAQLGKPVDATADLDAVLAADDPGGMHVRAYLQRARLRRAAGDTAGADADTAAALPLEPSDEIGWLLRGLARVTADPEGALADIEEAVRHNPQSVPALQNQVFVLEKLGRNEQALEAMNKLVPLAPSSMPLLASRGLFHARLGRFDLALRDATTALDRDRGKGVRLPAAGIYARASKGQPELKAEAVKLVADLIRDGVPAADLKGDPDLAELRDDPEFQKLVGGK